MLLSRCRGLGRVYGRPQPKSVMSLAIMAQTMTTQTLVSYHTTGNNLPPKESTLSKFNFPCSTHTISKVTKDLDLLMGQKVTLHGHLNRKPRLMSVNSFAELRDHSGQCTQLIMTPDSTPIKLFEELKKSIPEEAVSVTGTVKLKHPKPGQEHIKEWELLVEDYQVLNTSNSTALELDKLKHSNPESLPAHLRYLQLRTPFFQNALRKRSQASYIVRQVLIENHDFTEIETPLLFKSTPEGAREFLVPTRTRDKFYALPQSPQQYKQILMSSGFTRYFQLAKCFRDEDLRADRQPEFTQIDLEMSYINNSDQVGKVVEDVVNNLWRKVAKSPLYRPLGDDLVEEIEHEASSTSSLLLPKLPYKQALALYGIDKPDLRSTLKFVDLSEFFHSKKDPNYPIVEACVLRQALDKKKHKLPKFLNAAENYPGRKPIILPISSAGPDWHKNLVEAQVLFTQPTFDAEKLKTLLNLQPGDILAISTRSEMPYENPTPLGKFRQLAIQEWPTKWRRQVKDRTTGEISPPPQAADFFVGSWVVDFPLFNPVETDMVNGFPQYDFSKLESTHHPFTMVKSEDYEYLALDPLKAHGEHYDLVINGVEAGGGSRRVHDAELQKYILSELLEIENYRELFGHLLDALSLGCPPHAGLALGFDRLCTLLVGSTSIRDVIAFPKNQSGIDPMVESPTSVTSEVLDSYHIELKKLDSSIQDDFTKE